MLRKRQVVGILSVATIAFLLGTVVNFNFLAMAGKPADDDGSPWDDVWTAMSELQSRVESLNETNLMLNQTVQQLKTQMATKQEIMAVTAYPTWTELARGVWTDLLSIPNVTVSEGANVIAISSAFFKCMEQAMSPLFLRHRANNAYGAEYYQGFSDIWAAGTACETVEIHQAWVNLTAGTYTFAIQYWVYPIRELYVASARLTLMIFR